MRGVGGKVGLVVWKLELIGDDSDGNRMIFTQTTFTSDLSVHKFLPPIQARVHNHHLLCELIVVVLVLSSSFVAVLLTRIGEQCRSTTDS